MKTVIATGSRVTAIVTAIILTASLLAGCGNDNRILTFDEAFELVDTIPLDEEHLMYGAYSPDFNAAGDILVADYQGKNVLLFDRVGELIRTYDTADCDPGASFQPMVTLFLSDDRFLAAGRRGMAYEFNTDEGCLGKVESLARSPVSWCMGPDDMMYGYFYDPGGRRGVVVPYDTGLAPADTIRLTPTDFPRLNTTFGIWNYLSCSADGRLHFIYPELSAAIDARTGQAAPALPPDLYRPLSDEVEHSPPGPEGFSQGRQKSFANATTAMAVWATTGNQLITMFRNEGETPRQSTFYYHIAGHIAGNGNSRVVKVDLQQPWIQTVKDGYVYCLTIPGQETVEGLEEYRDHPNPVVLKYRLRI